jgi:predicted permease
VKPNWLLTLLIRTFPRDFRHAFGDGMLEVVQSDYVHARAGGRAKAAVFLVATAWDLVKTGVQERLRPSWKQSPQNAEKKREIGTMLEQWTRDLMYAARGLIRAPGFTLVTVVTLALAIGSNVAIFSVVDAVLLDPLPYPSADRLVAIRASAPGSDFPEEFNVSAEFYVQYNEHADLLDDLGMYTGFGATLRTDQFAERSRMAMANHSFFSTLGATPVLGRVPGPDDTDDVAVISHSLWTTRFGADSSILGRSLEIADEMRTVIGVMEPDLRIPEEQTAIWIPHIVGLSEIVTGRFFWGLVGRVKPGIDDEDFVVQLAPLAARLPERFGGSANYARLMSQHRPVVRPLKEDIVGDVARPLWILLGTVGLVLLIACANVANLFMVRSESRRRDLAVRQALGASRGRLVQGQMAEAILLAGIGGVAGALIAWMGVPVLLNAAPDRVPRMDAVGVDATSLLFTGAVAVTTALVFGLVPALRSSAASLSQSLRYAGRGSVAGRPKHLGRDALVVLQTALALVLLVGSGLLVRSFWELKNVDPGYDTANIFTFQVAPSGNMQDGPAFARFHYGLMDRLTALPGVESVGVVRELPLDEGTPAMTFVTEDSRDKDTARPFINYTFTGGDYFGTMGIELLSGRLFARADHETSLGNAIVSRSAAELLWPGEDPIGKRLRFPSDSSGWETVVGVVEDIHQNDFRQSAEELIYFPLVGRTPRSWGIDSPGYVVKSPRAATMAADVRELVRQVDPGAPFYAVHTLESLAAESMMRLSFTTLTLGLASSLALILGAVGLYGVLSYVVTQRTPEIGVRMALGATDREVRWMVVRQGGRIALVGIAVGVVAAVGVTRVLESLLFGIQAIDVSTFLGMSAVMLLVGLTASYVPARRASSVDPIRSLRTE